MGEEHRNLQGRCEGQIDDTHSVTFEVDWNTAETFEILGEHVENIEREEPLR